MKAPFPYFGGKTAVADLVWKALGDVKHYLEPFFGSGAVLLKRPIVKRENMETVNDADGFVANVWRAMQLAPDEVARWCDWPVNHADLMARRVYLLKQEGRILNGLVADPEWFDAKVAGYWIWAASCWVGAGLTRKTARPELRFIGKGVHALKQFPHVADAGRGVHALNQAPHISHTGVGVHALNKRPDTSHWGRGVHSLHAPEGSIYAWFRELSERLRRVRVVCGDWTKICNGNWQDGEGVVGFFLDPPYGDKDRRDRVYHADNYDIAAEVNAWALERGDRPTYRIVLAGYYEEHANLLKHGWKAHKWKAHGGYGNLGRGKTNGAMNRHRETLFLSPHCLTSETQIRMDL